MNKKVIDLKGKDVRKCVPKGLPYFCVDFGMQPGFAHIIEDEYRFSGAFAQVIYLYLFIIQAGLVICFLLIIGNSRWDSRP